MFNPRVSRAEAGRRHLAALSCMLLLLDAWSAQCVLQHGHAPPLVTPAARASAPRRFYLKRHLWRSTAALSAACAAVHLAKQGLKRATRRVRYVGPAVAFAADVALPTSVVGGAIVARLMF